MPSEIGVGRRRADRALAQRCGTKKRHRAATYREAISRLSRRQIEPLEVSPSDSEVTLLEFVFLLEVGNELVCRSTTLFLIEVTQGRGNSPPILLHLFRGRIPGKRLDHCVPRRLFRGPSGNSAGLKNSIRSNLPVQIASRTRHVCSTLPSFIYCRYAERGGIRCSNIDGSLNICFTSDSALTSKGPLSR